MLTKAEILIELKDQYKFSFADKNFNDILLKTNDFWRYMAIYYYKIVELFETDNKDERILFTTVLNRLKLAILRNSQVDVLHDEKRNLNESFGSVPERYRKIIIKAIKIERAENQIAYEQSRDACLKLDKLLNAWATSDLDENGNQPALLITRLSSD